VVRFFDGVSAAATAVVVVIVVDAAFVVVSVAAQAPGCTSVVIRAFVATTSGVVYHVPTPWMPPALLLCVEVSDNGDGVDVDDTRLLFQPFYLENDGALYLTCVLHTTARRCDAHLAAVSTTRRSREVVQLGNEWRRWTIRRPRSVYAAPLQPTVRGAGDGARAGR
jgi:hypothetical protein